MYEWRAEHCMCYLASICCFYLHSKECHYLLAREPRNQHYRTLNYVFPTALVPFQSKNKPCAQSPHAIMASHYSLQKTVPFGEPKHPKPLVNFPFYYLQKDPLQSPLKRTQKRSPFRKLSARTTLALYVSKVLSNMEMTARTLKKWLSD